MPTNTYVALDKVTVSNTTTSSITFTGISGSYTDLQLVISGYTITGSGAFVALRFNSDTASNYSATYLWGNGTTATSGRQTSQTSSTIGAFYSTQANIIANVQNYSNSTTYKTAVARSNSSANNTGAFVSLWRNTAAITSMTVLTTGGEYFNNGATFSLYGIAAQPVPTAKATGGTITYAADGYTYHTFTSSGTFTPSVALSCEVMAVGGGGAGGMGGGGGGGGGGGAITLFSAQSLTATGYTVTVGGGGSASSKSYPTNGVTSSFASLVTALGGGSGATQFQNAGSGGSGGGGGNDRPTAGGNSGSNTFAGGTGGGGNGAMGAGGGGATAAGGIANGDIAGNGGQGYTVANINSAVQYILSPMTVISSGGGGGAQGGSAITAGTGGTGAGNGGVGTGSNGSLTATSPTSYGSGGGGAAGYGSGTPSSGYGGLVIIRYAS